MERNEWSYIISSKQDNISLQVKQIWKYKQLIWMFVKRNITTMYKQTILGPLWMIIHPLLSTFVFVIVFGKIAKIPTQGIPEYLFYMAGNICWIFFSNSLSKIAITFTSNAHLFGKVYFPRLTVPISVVITNFISYMIQFFIFLGIFIYMTMNHADVHVTKLILLFPFLLLEIGLLSIGLGTLISALTAKYHDLTVLVGFGLQLWMYASPVVYPSSIIPSQYLSIYMLNPMASIIETFRYAFLGSGTFSWFYLGMGFVIILIVFFIGIKMFNKVEKTFIDTI